MDPRTIPPIMRGAIDLSALRNSAPSRPESAPADTQPGGGAKQSATTQSRPGGVTIIDVTEATFQSEVLERSLTTPVIIDFWAEWCGPCKQLSPVLEKLAIEGGGRWVLAKVDVDQNPRLAQAFRVQGIPMVFAVVGGQPIDAFTGVIPESQLRPWIEAVLKAGGVEPPVKEDPALTAADEALMSGNLDEAEQAYKKILAERPNDEAATAGLAQVGLMRRVNGVNPADALSAADANPDDIEAQLRAADIEVSIGKAEQAYARLVDLVRRTSGEDRNRVREHLLSLFSMAAHDDPAVASARRALANALF
ncbi:MAG TPA: tetratricopeptide repeat protein [Micromonosporaceae bacterium]|nr:tetratricopeptide repeat protein [Micromonosporaceae bacterium]